MGGGGVRQGQQGRTHLPTPTSIHAETGGELCRCTCAHVHVCMHATDLDLLEGGPRVLCILVVVHRHHTVLSCVRESVCVCVRYAWTEGRRFVSWRKSVTSPPNKRACVYVSLYLFQQCKNKPDQRSGRWSLSLYSTQAHTTRQTQTQMKRTDGTPLPLSTTHR